MIVKILVWLAIFLVGAGVLLWLISGGFNAIKVAIPHYNNPVQYLLKGTFSGGLNFNLPGTPSNFIPALDIDSASDTQPTVYQSPQRTSVEESSFQAYIQSYSTNGRAPTQEDIDRLRVQYEVLLQEARARGAVPQ